LPSCTSSASAPRISGMGWASPSRCTYSSPWKTRIGRSGQCSW